MRLPIKVIFDSNFLAIPGEFRIDIFEEVEKLLDTRIDGIILSPVLDELEKMSRSKSVKKAKMAMLALDFAKKLRNVRVTLEQNEEVDNLILRTAKEMRCPVATNDKKLKKKLRDIKLPVIYLRQRSRIVIEGVIECQ
jgi:hypothetical protein